MLVMQIQMWPGGDKTKAYPMGTITVALDEDLTVSDNFRGYQWRITTFNGKKTWKKGTIEGHTPNSKGPWDLLFRVLRKAVGSRNKT